MSRRITPSTSVDNLKREAKRWLRAVQAGDADATQRLHRALTDPLDAPTLRQMQLALAREFGFPGWTVLVRAVGSQRDRVTADFIARFLDNACPDHHVRGGSDHLRACATAMRMLEQYPQIASASLATRIVCGDVDGVRTILAGDPGAVNRRDGNPDAPRAGDGSAGDLIRKDFGPKGWTPLLYLAFTRLDRDVSNDNAVAIARVLLDAGADPNAHFMAGGSQYTPLVGVIGEGEEGRSAHPHRDALVDLLLEHGANPFDGQVWYNVNFRGDVLWLLQAVYRSTERRGQADLWEDPAWPMLDIWGRANGARWILDLAIRDDNVALAEWCLTHGADAKAMATPKARDRAVPRSLYEEAIRRGRNAIAELLVRHGAVATQIVLTPAEQLTAAALSLGRVAVDDVIRTHPDVIQSTEALFEVARRNRVEAVTLLLDVGVSVDVTDTHHETALHQAVYHNAVDAVRVLLDRGADANVVGTQYHNTPLGAAVYGRNKMLIDLLAPHSRDLPELVYAGKVDRVRDLLVADPALARVVHEGETLLMWLPPDDESVACAIAQLLLSQGADASVRNRAGMTAADRADRVGMDRLAGLLRGEDQVT